MKIDELKREIERHNRLYYIENNPEISDEEYDQLLKRLEELEGEQSFGSTLSSSSLKFKHGQPMLSLSNSYTIDELDRFDLRLKKSIDPTYVAEAKLDGLSINLIYREGRLFKALTRGDGIYGEDITGNALEIDSIPKEIAVDQLEVRGEVVMHIDEFNRLNSLGDKIFANPRNAAAGTIRNSDIERVRERELECYFYHIIGDYDQKDALERLSQLGFRVNPHYLYCNDIDEVKRFIDSFRTVRATLPYQTDGVVVKVNSHRDRKLIGFTNKSPRWAIAFKYPATQVVTRVESVDFQLGRSGIITPVANLRPVVLDGSTISRASLHNFDYIDRRDIQIGDYVFIEKGGDVIPKVIKAIESRREGSVKVERPSLCPYCFGPVDREGAYIYCKSDCDEVIKKKIAFFASKGAMSIDGLGSAIVSRLFDLSLIRDAADIYDLKADDIMKLDGFKEKSTNNLLESIERSKLLPYSSLLFSLGVRHLGMQSARYISKFSIEELKSKSVEELSMIDGIGEVIALSIYNFFKDSYDFILKLRDRGLNFNVERVEGALSGKSIAVTGRLSQPREEFKRGIESLGGELLSSISSKVNYLIVGESPGSKLKRAELLNSKGYKISILDEKQFIEKFF